MTTGRSRDRGGTVPPLVPLKSRMAVLECGEIERELAAARGNVRETAKALGISERNAWLKIKNYGIEPRAYRSPEPPAV